MRRLFYFGWLVTIVLFLVALLFVYANLSEMVIWQKPAQHGSAQTLPRDSFFYLSIAIFILSNITCYVFSRMLNMLHAISGAKQKGLFSKENLLTWFPGFVIVINVFFIASIIFIGLINNIEEDQLSRFYYLAFIAPFLFGLCLVWLAIILFKKK